MNGAGRRARRPAQRAADPQAYAGLVNQIREDVLAGDVPVTGARLAAAVHASGRLLGSDGGLRAVDRVHAELQGLGPLQGLLRIPGLTDILVNGPREVWIDTGAGLSRTEVSFSSEAELQGLAVRLIAAGGRRLDDSSPCADVQLRGCRVHAVLPPVSTGSTLLSIRVRAADNFSLEELQAAGMMGAECARILRSVVASRLNFLISGATGTGKTTLLSGLLSLCPPHERLVLIEDAAELMPGHPHVIGLQARHTNIERAGSVDLADLLRQAMRMRPDRLIVGECRGAEVRELLAAMNTGHDGAGGTIHASAASTVPARLAALGALAGLNARALTLQAAGALDALIHLERDTEGRRVAEIAVLDRAGDGALVALTALDCRPGVPEFGPGWKKLQARLTAKTAW
ncbi:TadA family conjugal transfer-associated ATPase [Arthrobacter gandavensis]|uniref:TadA family conjugal transfer-associated ATPase n=1 Tax=Arthrobacter gandavensis TaxID=169960 RepID=UPI00188F7520|nr:TadA family conjugal transfer-associated ATPase [Arthrobacter gandavensis]MBF4994115.1 TadA family conjugal transfer-associated ATPase [Arthrobacter gandavensis]